MGCRKPTGLNQIFQHVSANCAIGNNAGTEEESSIHLARQLGLQCREFDMSSEILGFNRWHLIILLRKS